MLIVRQSADCCSLKISIQLSGAPAFGTAKSKQKLENVAMFPRSPGVG